MFVKEILLFYDTLEHLLPILLFFIKVSAKRKNEFAVGKKSSVLCVMEGDSHLQARMGSVHCFMRLLVFR